MSNQTKNATLVGGGGGKSHKINNPEAQNRIQKPPKAYILIPKQTQL